MAERELNKRLEDLRNSGCEIYSISRLNCVNQCQYQAYLNYILGEKQASNIWACAGGVLHDRLEECVRDGADESIIKNAIQEELDNFDLLGIDFPLDRNGNPTIRDNWIANMTRFSEEFKTPKGKFETEQLILYPIDDNTYMQGYIDLIQYHKDGSISIIDWKTSSQFTGNHLIEAGRQLVLYGLAKQLEGYDVKSLKWAMLKYCVTSWTLKNGKTKEKISEWRNLIKDMKSPIEKALSDLGYDDTDIECMIADGIKANKWDVFPQEIQDKFKTRIYVREYEMTQEVIDETLEYIKKSINMYRTLKEWKPCDINKDSFFCASLCGYGGKTGKCQYWVDYCDQFKEESSDDDDLF